MEDVDLELPEDLGRRSMKKAFFGIIFFRCFEYKEISLFLFKNHGIEMSLEMTERHSGRERRRTAVFAGYFESIMAVAFKL